MAEEDECVACPGESDAEPAGILKEPAEGWSWWQVSGAGAAEADEVVAAVQALHLIDGSDDFEAEQGEMKWAGTAAGPG